MNATWRLSAAELGAAYRRREIDPLAVFDALSDRIGRINPSLTAIVEIEPHARAAARRSAERFERGEPLGPLDGVPITIKDNILVAGMHCRWGSRLYADYVPSQDELPVARLRAAGAVIVGKTNVPEFTLEGSRPISCSDDPQPLGHAADAGGLLGRRGGRRGGRPRSARVRNRWRRVDSPACQATPASSA